MGCRKQGNCEAGIGAQGGREQGGRKEGTGRKGWQEEHSGPSPDNRKNMTSFFI